MVTGVYMDKGQERGGRNGEEGGRNGIYISLHTSR